MTDHVHVACPSCGRETVLHEGARVRCICGETYPRSAGEAAYERAHPEARAERERKNAELFDRAHRNGDRLDDPRAERAPSE